MEERLNFMEDIEVTSQEDLEDNEDGEESQMEDVDNQDDLDKLRTIYETLNNDMYGDVISLLLELLNMIIRETLKKK